MNKLIYLLTFAIPVFVFGQSGWTKNKKSYFFKLDYSFYKANDFRNLNGESTITTDFNQKSVALYGEYGITDKFTIQTFVPIYKQNGFEETTKVSGFGDVQLEFKYALLTKNFPLALSIAPEFPTGKSNNFAEKVNVADGLSLIEKINLPTGDGEFNVWTTLAVSHSFAPKNLYASAYTAFNYRTQFEDINFQNQIKAGVEVGYKFFDKLWLNSKVTVLKGVGSKPKFADFIRGNGTSYTGIAAGAMYEFGKNIAITADYFNSNGLIVKAENVYVNNIFSVGIVYQR